MNRLLLLAAPLLLAAAPGPDLDSVFVTERAFATRAGAVGVPQSFTEFAAPTGVVFTPAPTPVAQVYGGKPAGDARLDWRPTYGGVAASNDLAFDTGPWTLTGKDGKLITQGYFFTVWGRQADGQWRFLADNGVETGVAGESFATAPRAALTPKFTRGDLAGARAADTALNAALAKDARRLPLAKDGWALRNGGLPGRGSGVAALLARGPAALTLTQLKGGTSAAGDLAWVCGGASWSEGGAPKTGSYLRVWRREGSAWTLVIDALVDAPG